MPTSIGPSPSPIILFTSSVIAAQVARNRIGASDWIRENVAPR